MEISMASEFTTLGYPGLWYKVVKMPLTGSLIATGSNFGVGGIMTVTGATGSITLPGGTDVINVAHLQASLIHELSINTINSTGSVYLFYKSRP